MRYESAERAMIVSEAAAMGDACCADRGKKNVQNRTIRLCASVLLLAALLILTAVRGTETTLPLSARIPNNEQVVLAIRKGLREHAKEITVSFDYHENLLDEVTALTGEWMEQALAETERPDEGDYLRYQTGGYESTSSYSFEAGVYHYRVRIVPKYYCYLVQEEAVSEKLPELMDSFGFTPQTPEIEKLRTIYDFVCQNVRYDKVHEKHPTATLRSTAYSALIWRSATCQGYCVLLYRMLRTAGLDCRIVTGTAGEPGNEEYHAWNLVRLGEAWYALDATWDAGKESYQYFMKTEAELTNHIPDAAFRTEAFRAACPPAA